MLSPDPYVQVPEYSQNFNRYSYVMNNPMNTTDPTGFSWLGNAFHKMGGWLKANWQTVVVIVVAAILVCTGVGSAIGGAMFASLYGATGAVLVPTLYMAGASAMTGAVIGSVTGALGAALAGGDMGDVLRGAVVGGTQGAITSGFLHGVEQASGTYNAQTALHIAGHGVVGGAANVAMGGKFGDGFLSAAVSAAAGDAGLFGAPGGGMAGKARRTIMAGVVGGTASALGGGKFANGAYTAAFQNLLNREMAGFGEKISGAWRLFQNWKAGTAPIKDYYGPGTFLSDGLRNSNGADNMRSYYYNSGKPNIDNFDYTWPNSPLGIWRILTAGLDGAEQFIGSWQNGSVARKGNTLLFMIEAPTSNESWYRPARDLGLSMPGNTFVGPQRSIMNIIWWTELYNPAPYRPAIESQGTPIHLIPTGF